MAISNAIKQITMNVMENSQMCDLRLGTVASVSPLKVKITNQFVLPSSLLIVPEHLTDHVIMCTVTEPNKSTMAVTVHNALKIGDRVALLRQQGGKSYLILDRV